MSEMEEQIADAIVALLENDATLSDINYVAFGDLKTAINDFVDPELPAVQLYDERQTVTHEAGRGRYVWPLVLEIIMKPTVNNTVDQKSLWDLRRRIELVLWANPNLNIPGVNQLMYKGSMTDYHSLKPYYIGLMEFDVIFRRPLANC